MIETEIKEIDEKHIAIIETNVKEELISKESLEAKKIALQEKIAEVDEILTHFSLNIKEE